MMCVIKTERSKEIPTFDLDTDSVKDLDTRT